MKLNGLDRTKKLSRIPIQMAQYIEATDYKFLDYLLFRNGLEDYQIHISTMVKELNLSKPTIIVLCKKYLGLGILNQDNGQYQYQREYHLNYTACESFIYSLMDGVRLVKPLDQSGKASLPGLVKPVDRRLVKPVDHTSIRKEFIKNNIQVGQIPEPLPIESKPVTLVKETPKVSVTPSSPDWVNEITGSTPNWVKELQSEMKDNYVTSYKDYSENIQSRYN